MGLKDFMVHKEFKFRPSARLNVVIGPSGAGKSAILAALCVCLGGKPKYLGRVSNFRDFVRKGCKQAEVEVRHGVAAGLFPHVGRIDNHRCPYRCIWSRKFMARVRS